MLHSSGYKFAPSQLDLDQLSKALNKRFHAPSWNKTPSFMVQIAKVYAWEPRASWSTTNRAGRTSAAQDAFTGIIWLLSRLLKCLLHPLILVGWLPVISLSLNQISTFASLTDAVNNFVEEHKLGKDQRIHAQDLLGICEGISPSLCDRGVAVARALSTIDRRLEKGRILEMQRRWRFLFPVETRKSDERSAGRRITYRDFSEEENRQNAHEGASEQAGRHKQENLVLANILLAGVPLPSACDPPIFLSLEYHSPGPDRHSVLIHLDGDTLTISKHLPKMPPYGSVGFELAVRRYCETADCLEGSFTRRPSDQKWAEFNEAIRSIKLPVQTIDFRARLILSPRLVGARGDELGEHASDETSWTFFIHYGDRFVFTGDLTRGPIGHQVAAAVAELIRP